MTSHPVENSADAPNGEALDEFARGTLDVVRQVCAALIGRGLLDAEDLQGAMQGLAVFWRDKGAPKRAEPAEQLAEALRGMAKVKRAVGVDIFPAPRGVN